MRILAAVLISILWALPVGAETFLGRTLIITDARKDNKRPAAVVIAMHGFLGTARSMRKKTGFDQLARQHGFIAVYPNGRGRKWNDGRSPRNKVDDVGYLSALIARLVGEGRADPKRIYLAGHSNGGGMAMRMACDQPELVAGISVAATKVAANYQCANGRAIPAIFFHGTVDPVAPHSGRSRDSRLGHTLSGDQTRELWRKRNRCRDRGRQERVDAREDGTVALIQRFVGCRAAFTYVLIEGHGHGWPGAGPILPRIQGPASAEIDAATLSWTFFDGS